MLLLGVVGLPGSGKTTLALLLESLGAQTISGDRIGHDILVDDDVVKERLVGLFGDTILQRDGSVSRKRLGERVASDERSLQLLNEVMHPRLLDRLASEIRAVENPEEDQIVAVDAALIPEWGIEAYFDLVVYIQCESVTRSTRLQSAGRDAALIKQLERYQLPEVDKRRRCHIILDNEGTMQEFRHRGVALYEALAYGSRMKGDSEQCRRKLWTG